MTRRAIHWVCDAPSPYNGFLFRSLTNALDADLTIHFIRLTLDSHPWQRPALDGFSWKVFDRRFLADWSFVRSALITRRRDVFVIGGWYEMTTQLALSLCTAPFVVWSDTPNLTSRRHPAKALLRAHWLRWVFGRAAYVMGTGQPALDAFAQMGCPTEKLVNFPYYVDLDEFRPAARRDDREVVFLSSGRLHRDKGFDVALCALAKAYRATGARFRYRLAGVGPAQTELESLASELGIRDLVEFLGWMEPADLPDFYRSGTVLIHPARAEPYGVSVLEAMASGLPVLGSTATGAAVDRVVPGANGLLHVADDVDTLAGQVQSFLNNRLLAGEMGGKARATAEQWPVERAVSDLERLLARIDTVG
jgi:glycosyltransferase involved in cell wall biosynthesis